MSRPLLKGAMLLLAAVFVVGSLQACTSSRYTTGKNYRTMGWYGHYGVSPRWRCCRSSPPVIVVPPEEVVPPEPALPIEPPQLEAVPLPSVDFGGADIGGDFGGDFGDW